MSGVIAWMAAEAERPEANIPADLAGDSETPHFSQSRGEVGHPQGDGDQGPENSGAWSGVGDESSVVRRPSGALLPLENSEGCSNRPDQLPTHQFPARRVAESAEDLAQVRQPHSVSPAFLALDDRPSPDENPHVSQRRRDVGHPASLEQSEELWDSRENELERRIYRRRTVAMLRRYLRYSIETGRLPSLVGREYFRAKVTKYTMHTLRGPSDLRA